MYRIHRFLIWAGALVAVAGLLIAAVNFLPAEGTEEEATAGEWTCSMHPQIRQPKPGHCPICGMDLVPVKDLSGQQNQFERAGLVTEPVKARELFKEIRTVGKLDYNERHAAYLTARIAGRVDRVYADFTGISVKRNDHLVEIYSPELFIAQGELIRALDAKATASREPGAFEPSFADANLEAARTKLRLLGLLPEQIRDIETSRQTRTHLTVHAPIGGTVIEKGVRAGQYVKEGDVLFRIADLDPIWLYLDLYEYDVGWVRFGQPVDMTLEAFPGETFRGTVTFIDPFLEDRTRTVRARVNLPNPERKLKPGMYAAATVRVRLRADGTAEPTGLEGKYVCPMHPEVVWETPGNCNICDMPLERVPEGRHLSPSHPAWEGHTGHEEHQHYSAEPGKVLAIPASAVLDTGRRRVVYRETADGAYELVEVTLGSRAEGKDDRGDAASYYAVLAGLKPDDRVVVRGGFMLDSQRQIEGMPSLLHPHGQAPTGEHAGGGATGTTGHKH